jgi:hypothetical protein
MKQTMKGTLYSLIVLMTIMSAFAQVVITPSNPTADQDLICSMQGGNTGAYAYHWFLGTDEKSASPVLSQSLTQPSQTWTCKVFIPATAITKHEIYVSEASVTTAALFDPDKYDYDQP